MCSLPFHSGCPQPGISAYFTLSVVSELREKSQGLESLRSTALSCAEAGQALLSGTGDCGPWLPIRFYPVRKI